MPIAEEDDCFLIEATKNGKESDVRHLLTSAYSSRDVRDSVGRSALHWAAEYDYFRIACLLVESKWDVNARDEKKQTPLHIACNHHHVGIATCLIAVGCDVNTADLCGNTPLHRAVRANLEPVVSMLCEYGADINLANECLWTPLHEAMRTGNEGLALKLLEHGADVNWVLRNNMSTFLNAVFYYRIAPRNTYNSIGSILRILIDRGCRLSHSDGQWSALSAAVSIDLTDVATLLILHGCRVERKGKYSRSLLVEMFDRCEPRLVKLYVMAGYYPTWEEIDQCSRRVPNFSRSFKRLALPGVTDIGSARRHLLEWLRQRTSTPFSLSEIARASIRRALNEASSDTSILPAVAALPLPSLLKRYISLSDLAAADCLFHQGNSYFRFKNRAKI